MEYTLEQIAGIKNALPFLNALDDDQLKKQLEEGKLEESVKNIVTLTEKPKFITEGKNAVIAEFGKALRKKATELDPNINTETDEWKESPIKVFERVLSLKKQDATPAADTTQKDKDIAAIKAQIEASIKEQYKPIEDRAATLEQQLKQYELQALAAQKTTAVNKVLEKIPLVKDTPKYGMFEFVLNAKLADLNLESLGDLGTALKDKNGDYAKDGEVILTLETLVKKLAADADVIRVSDTPAPPQPPTNQVPQTAPKPELNNTFKF